MPGCVGEIFTHVVDQFEKYDTLFGKMTCGMLPVSGNTPIGQWVGALPSGRNARTPLTDGIGATGGTDVNGPTALLKSVSHIPHARFTQGTQLNMKFEPEMLKGEDGIAHGMNMLKTMCMLDVYHAQINCVDRETLIDAQVNPDKHRDLLIRVAGYTAFFVELGKEGCVVYSRSGKKLNSIQSGYARPALAAGRNRFVLYNRSGNELRVESRTQNLYTKQMENSIFLCAVADNGNLAVVTEDISAMAKLLVYNANMEEVLRWSMSSNDGTPLRMAFSPDSRKLAAAAVTASGGQMMTNLYLINLASGDPVSIANQSGVPQWLGWTSASTLLAVYDTRVVLYNAGGGERAAYEFAGNTLKDVSVDAAGNIALLLGSGQLHQTVLLDKNLNVQFSGSVASANAIVRAGSLFYLLSDSGVECCTVSGERQWSQTLAAKPQALLADAKELLLFSGNTAQVLEPPQE